MTSAEAIKRLRQCVESGIVIFRPHAIAAMKDDKISRADVFNVLKGGNIYNPAEEDLKTGEWKYGVEAKVDNREIAAVFKFEALDRTVIITVFEVK